MSVFFMVQGLLVFCRDSGKHHFGAPPAKAMGREVFGKYLDNLQLLACQVRKERRGWALAGLTLSPKDVTWLYERHGAALLVYARSFLPDGAGAEDVVQGVFLKLLRGETKTPDVPLAYLYRAVRNAALNVRRDRASETPLNSETTWFAHRREDREAVLALQVALRELPEEQRQVVIMRLWSGLTLEEAAQITGVPANTAASRYRYALDKLRERMKPWHRMGESSGDE